MATAMGEASIHILRLSGPQAGNIIDKCFEPHNLKRWTRGDNFTLNLGVFKDESKVLDEVLVGRMLGPFSYTGEVVLEPMNAHERRIIHTTLQGETKISTLSEGNGPNRRVVISLKCVQKNLIEPCQ